MALFQLVIASLSVFSLCVETKVVNTFDECKEFFYKESHPNAFDQNNYAKICQKYNNHYHFATLYSTQDRIPVYSAYTLNFHCRQSAGRQATWFIEPQLSNFNEDDMRTQNNDGDTIKMNQAIPAFYSDTNYDRGHLNPNSYQHEYGRHATFTLTNAVPMDACFNRMQWKQYEDEMKRMVLSLYGTGTPYFVTGSVPSEEKMPVPVLDSTENERDFKMVTVPRYVWTAFCFHATDEEDSFSLGYIGENKPEAVIYPKSIDELNTLLQDLYNMPDFRVFTDHCFASNSLSKRNLNSLIQFQVKQIAKSGAYDSFSKKAQNKISAVYKRRRESSHPPMNSMVLDLMVKMDYVNMPQWFENNEMLKHHSSVSCVFKTDIPTFHPPRHIELRSANNYDLSCALVSEKSTLGSDITADGTRCMKGETCSGSCNTEKGVKLCCTTPCLYNENGASFMCSSGSQTIKCSPQYSQVTETGKPCKPDHECGTYGEDYYWCYIYGKEWERCISPFKPETPTTGGNSNGAPCKFPFIYNGKEYYHCTTDHAESRRLWCATVSNYDQDAKWGYCPLSGIVTVGGNDPGKECVFPFYYEGRHYFRCTTKNNNHIPWCATTSDYPRDNKWGNCPFTGPPTTGGNSNGASCKFPFKYNDKDYYYCTTDNAETKQLWCATVSNYAQDPKWGYCPTSGIVTVGGNDPGKECVFPFSYDKQMYFECTTINNNRIPWCATTSDYPQDNKWGNCPFTGPPTTDGNSNGAPCKFPFKYNDKDYYYCTTDNEESKKLWCATVSNYAQDPKWGYCPTSGIFTVGGNDPGRECVFPFYYEEKMYFECTLKNSDKGSWCATTSDYPKDSKWGYCV